MKKILTLLVACGLILLKAPVYANDQALSDCEYDANEGYEKCEPIGYGSSTATSNAISMSMVGWGLGLAIAIAILAGVIHQSAAAHSDSSS